jgi:hypothetical protein
MKRVERDQNLNGGIPPHHSYSSYVIKFAEFNNYQLQVIIDPLPRFDYFHPLA